MIHIKTPDEIKVMKKAGAILADVLQRVCDAAVPGVTELELDALAEKLIRNAGGEPGFQKVPGFKHTICVATNDVVVHGIPSNRVLKEGDIIGIDCGVFMDGFHTDMANTVYVGDQTKEDPEIKKFLKAGEDAMWAGIAQVKPGNRIGHVSQAVQEIIEDNGYSVVRELIGHGVGRDLHEEPEVPGYLARRMDKTPELQEGMVIAVEVIYTMGSRDIIYANNDGWTIATRDRKLAGLSERTVVVTKQGHGIITEC